MHSLHWVKKTPHYLYYPSVNTFLTSHNSSSTVSAVAPLPLHICVTEVTEGNGAKGSCCCQLNRGMALCLSIIAHSSAWEPAHMDTFIATGLLRRHPEQGEANSASRGNSRRGGKQHLSAISLSFILNPPKMYNFNCIGEKSCHQVDCAVCQGCANLRTKNRSYKYVINII